MKCLQVSAEFKPKPTYSPTPRELQNKMALIGSEVFYNPRIELIDKPIPHPKSDEVLIKIGSCGVCGSDTMFLEPSPDNYSQFVAHCKLPCVIGHEYSGEIVEIGSKVKDLNVGDLVVAETMNWCGECPACRQGLFNQCQNLEELGFTLDGGFAEYMIAKSKYCFVVNRFTDIYGTKQRALEAAAVIEPTAVAYNGMFICSGGFSPGGYVAVYGCGPIGLSAISLASISGAAKIIAFDRHEDKLQKAKTMGADVVYNVNELKKANIRQSQIIMEETGGVGAMLQVEATKTKSETMLEMGASIADGGKIVQIGVGGQIVDFDPFKLQTKAASFSASIGSSGHGIWQNIIRLVENRKLDISKLIACRYPLDDVLTAIKHAKFGVAGKILVNP